MLAAGCWNSSAPRPLPLVSQRALGDTSFVYYVPFESYPKGEDFAQLPIGVTGEPLDAAIITDRLMRADFFNNITGAPGADGVADFAGENFQCLFDAANAPYDGYNRYGHQDFLIETSVVNSLFLMSDKYFNLAADRHKRGEKLPVKHIVGASWESAANVKTETDTLLLLSGCGVRYTSISDCVNRFEQNLPDVPQCIGVLSSFPLPALKENIKTHFFVQNIYDVDACLLGNEAYADSTAVSCRENYEGPVLGLQDNNIQLSYLDRYRFNTNKHGILYSFDQGQITKIQLNSVENYLRFHIVSMLQAHRSGVYSTPISKVMLCTYHAPDIREMVERLLAEMYDFKSDGVYIFRKSLAQNVEIIDPTDYMVKECYQSLRLSGMLALRTEKTGAQIFVTVPSPGTREENLLTEGSFLHDYKYSRQAAQDSISYKAVPVSSRHIGFELGKHLSECAPTTYQLLKNSL